MKADSSLAGGRGSRSHLAWLVINALDGPVGWALERGLRLTRRRLGVAVVYHRVGDPAGDPETELLPALGTKVFRAQLGLMRSRFRVVPAAELASAAALRRRFEPFPMSITFDDDWSGHADVSLALLADAGVQATFFLSGASLEAPYGFWYELVQDAFDGGLRGPPRAVHAEAARVESLRPVDRVAYVKRLTEQLGPLPPARGLRAASVRRIAQAGHEIGFHTRQHHSLTTLDGPALECAMRDGREALETAAGVQMRAIAYPGGAADSRTVECARAAGFERGYHTLPHPVGEESDPLWLGRVAASPLSAGRLRFAVARALLFGTRASSRPATAPAGVRAQRACPAKVHEIDRAGGQATVKTRQP